MLLFNFQLRNPHKLRLRYEHVEPWREFIKKIRLWPFNYLIIEFVQYHPFGLWELLMINLNTCFSGPASQRFALNISLLGVILSLRVEDMRQFNWNQQLGKYELGDDHEQL